ncbi:hypothetical protein BT69DRAFT_1332775 [Atractiella rhizophila]|nr:hypothetical protein BT69DRAFT_1332775 [Atractiella rhizophila]
MSSLGGGLRDEKLVTLRQGGQRMVDLARTGGGAHESEEHRAETTALSVICLGHLGLMAFDGLFDDPVALKKLHAFKFSLTDFCLAMVTGCYHEDPHVHSHALDGLRACVGYVSQEEWKALSAEDRKKVEECLVGHLCAPKLWARQVAMTGIIWIFESNAMNPLAMMTASSRFDAECRDAMKNFYANPTDSMVSHQMSNLNEFQDMLYDLVNKSDRDFYKVGKRLHELLMTDEFVIGHGFFSMIPRESNVPPLPSNLNSFIDLLPVCADAIRERDGSDSVEANCLELKFELLNQRHQKARTKALKSTEKFPEVPYFYYVAAMVREDSPSLGVEIARKGLRCDPEPRAYVKLGLLRSSITLSTMLALKLGQADEELIHLLPHGSVASVLSTILRSAREDCRTYMEEAGPDARELRVIILERILLEVTLEGHQLRGSLQELKAFRERLRVIDKISALIYNEPALTQGRKSVQFILSHFSSAQKQWQPVFNTRKSGDDVAEEMKLKVGMDDLATNMAAGIRLEEEEDGFPVSAQ